MFAFLVRVNSTFMVRYSGLFKADFDFCVQEEGYEEIRGEIEMLQQCSHPNVVRYLGSYQGEEYLWVCEKTIVFTELFESFSLSIFYFCLKELLNVFKFL